MSENKLLDKHIQNLLKKTKENPKDVELQINLGEAYLLDGQIEEARSAFYRATELDPNSNFLSSVWEWSGYTYKKSGDISKAITEYTQWAQASKEARPPLDHWGGILVQENRLLDLKLLFTTYKKSKEQESDPGLYESLALLHYILEPTLQDSETTTLELAGEALELQGDSLPMRYLMGLLYVAEEDTENAISEFQRVINLDTEGTWRENRFNLNWSSKSANLELARLYRASGDLASALIQYKKGFEELSPADVHLNKVLKVEAHNSSILQEMMETLAQFHNYKDIIDLFQAASDIVQPISDKKEEAIKRAIIQVQNNRDNQESLELNEEVIGEILRHFTEELPDVSIKDEVGKIELLQDIPQDVAESIVESLFNSMTTPSSELEFPELRSLRAIYAYSLVKCGRLEDADKIYAEDTLKIGDDSVDENEEQCDNNFDHYKKIYDKVKEATDPSSKRKAALCLLQMENIDKQEEFRSLTGPRVTSPVTLGSDSGILFIGAKVIKGNGQILSDLPQDFVTNYALPVTTYLKSNFKYLDLPDLNNRDVVIDLLIDRQKIQIPEEHKDKLRFTNTSLALLVAIYGAARFKDIPEYTLICGDVDMYGQLTSTPTLAKSLAAILDSDTKIEQIIVPLNASDDLYQLYPKLLAIPKFHLCRNVDQVLQVLNYREGKNA